MTRHRTNAPQYELPAEIGAVFNLHGDQTGDGWREQDQADQLAADRAAAAKRQPDMFPDVDMNRSTTSRDQEGAR